MFDFYQIKTQTLLWEEIFDESSGFSSSYRAVHFSSSYNLVYPKISPLTNVPLKPSDEIPDHTILLKNVLVPIRWTWREETCPSKDKMWAEIVKDSWTRYQQQKNQQLNSVVNGNYNSVQPFRLLTVNCYIIDFRK